MPKLTEQQQARVAELVLAGHDAGELMLCVECDWVGLDSEESTGVDDTLHAEPIKLGADFLSPGVVIPGGNCPDCLKSDEYIPVYPIDAPRNLHSKEEAAIDFFGSLTPAEANELLAALELRAHQFRIKGTSHGEDVAALHEKVRAVVAVHLPELKSEKLAITGHVVEIRSPKRGL